MEQRLNYPRLAPEATRAMTALGSYLATCGLEPSLLELVKIRASQMNGCSFCIDMHTKDARAGGETEQRIYALNAWRETPFFSDRERAALAWVEALTHIGNGVPDDLYAEAKKEFSEKELVDLTWAAAAINAWNRSPLACAPCPGRINQRDTVLELPGEETKSHLARTGLGAIRYGSSCPAPSREIP